MKRDAQE